MKILLKISLLLLIVTVSCQAPKQKKEVGKTEKNKMELPQSEDALLEGLSKAICYSGFRSGQHPDRGEGAKNPSYEEILEDLTILSQDSMFQLIRLYDSGVNSKMVLKVIQENNINMKVLLGIWLDAELSAHETCEWLTEPIPKAELDSNKEKNKKEIAQGIRLANAYPQIVCAVNVGNESLVEWNDHKVDTDSIISYVNHIKSEIEQAVTVADNYKWWVNHGADLAQAVDFVSIHVYPVWEGKDLEEGISYTIENVKEVQAALPGRPIVITEAGWATIASEFGERASEEKQLKYYNWMMDWSKENNITTFFFEAFDEDWKGNTANPLGAEKHWGIFTVDRKPKLVMQEFYPALK
ncbi:glycosyl hydrolase family 17 protein [Labilibacter marinus]|uniref:glycosyl hydrolase family 17 protein n=1 Tax=Labilibacter marinus TaxID=1477105 RepID=UPI0009F8D7BD|nr:glycosyl hydrolase family 17 protein [Labilibacter marinus]